MGPRVAIWIVGKLSIGRGCYSTSKISGKEIEISVNKLYVIILYSSICVL